MSPRVLSRLARLRWLALMLVPATACGGSSPAQDATGSDAAREMMVDGQDEVGAQIDAVGAETAGAEVVAATDSGRSDVEEAPLRILFVGNSYTQVNDLPSVVAKLIEAAPGGPRVEVESVLAGGAELFDHWETTGAKARIAAGGHDVVVIQGQSTEALRNGFGFTYYAEKFQQLVAAAGGRLVWYATWARRAGDPYYEVAFHIHDQAEMARRIDQYYYLPPDVTARVGAAFQIAVSELPLVELYADDGSHPSAAGTLLAACVITHAITNEPPVVPESALLGVSAATAEALCAIAPRVRCYFDFTNCDGQCVNITNDTQNCGTCGNTCADGEPCGPAGSGVCGCPPTMTACGGLCYSLWVDPQNCGSCGYACPDGHLCADGDCGCGTADLLYTSPDALTALRPACRTEDAISPTDCDEAAHLVCAANECFNTSLGAIFVTPVRAAPNGPESVLACTNAALRTTTYAELQTLEAGCDPTNPSGAFACDVAVARLCASTGMVSGFGPVANEQGVLTVSCVDNATIVPVPWSDLQSIGRCVRDERAAPGCKGEVWRQCRLRQYSAGFGPIAYASGEDAVVVCIH